MRRRYRLRLFALALPALLVACGDSTVAEPTPAVEPAAAASTDVPAPAVGELAGDGAMIYDLKADWSDTENPNGPWSVNAGNEPLVSVADLSTTGIDVWDFPQPGFTAQPIFGDITPVWFQARGPLDNGDPDWEVGDIVTHTSRSIVPNSNVTWTSDAHGLIDIRGSVWATREFGRTNDWFLYFNDELLTSGTVSGGDPHDRDDPFLLEEGSGGEEPLTSLLVFPGDVVKLEFEQRFGFGEDYVGVDLTVTLIGAETDQGGT